MAQKTLSPEFLPSACLRAAARERRSPVGLRRLKKVGSFVEVDLPCGNRRPAPGGGNGGWAGPRAHLVSLIPRRPLI